MSNNQMISVPRDELEAACQRFAKAQIFDFSRRMRDLLVQPAEQHQGEPVTKLTLSQLLADLPDGYSKDDVAFGWHECVDNYTHADPAEVERLRAGLRDEIEAGDSYKKEADDLRTQVEKLQAGFYQQVTDTDLKKISDYLSNPDLPKGAFLRQDAYDLANMCLHMVREVQASRVKMTERDALLREWLELHRRQRQPVTLHERTEAALSASAEPSAAIMQIPDGYCVMPQRLTAENGAKALLLGEFKLEVTEECPECRELDEPIEGCEICDGEGEYGQRHTIPWDQIKFIYSVAVKGLALKP